MTKLKMLLVLLSLIVIYSCEDNLNPYGDFKEKFILNCIIHGDTTYQVATISKSYMKTNGELNENNFVENAVLRIWSGDKIGIFKDTVNYSAADQKNIHYYYTKSFQPYEKSEIEIEAILPDGRKLSSKSVVPEKVTIKTDRSDFNITSKIDSLKVYWSTRQDRPIFSVRLKISYLHFENNGFVTKSFIVPQKYISKDNKQYPIYPPLSNRTFFEIDRNTISEAMRQISGSDERKADYSITGAVLEITMLDMELTKYYYAVNRNMDSYSIKTDETDYTNINGGLGIFGVTVRNFWKINFSREYVESFGYEPFF